MKSTYTKLFQRILYSTIWSEDDKTRIVWITMLAMADSEGNIASSIPGLSRAANVDMESVQNAIAKFLSPDEYSGTKDHEGRRVEEIEGGWRLLNHAKYRNLMSLEHRRDYNRLKQQEYRIRVKTIDKEKTLKQVVREKVKAEDFSSNEG